MKKETCYAKNKPLSLTDNKCDKHVKRKLLLSSHQRTHIYNKILHYFSSAIITSGALDRKDNLSCVPKLHRVLVIILHFKNSDCYLLQTEHARTF